MDDGEIIFHTVNGLPEDYLSLKQTIRTQCATTSLSFSAVSAMLVSEDLYLDHSQDASTSSTILLAQHQGSVSQGSTTAVPSSGSQIPQGASSVGPFQYPVEFGPQAPQFGPPSSQIPNFNQHFGSNNFGGHRNGFNRNQNRV
ncbi:hypothetical protein RHMOL_Rhmol10G0164500 [Rhododendron molle]|nr:hypothetical protein RHMOL_Rhmol10G0164500 [Rhododendron molle]